MPEMNNDNGAQPKIPFYTRSIEILPRRDFDYQQHEQAIKPRKVRNETGTRCLSSLPEVDI